MEENECRYTLPQVEIFNIEVQVIQKGAKVGAEGLEPPTSRMRTLQTEKRENCVSTIVLLEVEFFKVKRFLQEP